MQVHHVCIKLSLLHVFENHFIVVELTSQAAAIASSAESRTTCMIGRALGASTCFGSDPFTELPFAPFVPNPSLLIAAAADAARFAYSEHRGG